MSLISQLSDIFNNPDFPSQVSSISKSTQHRAYLRIDASLTDDSRTFLLGYIDLHSGQLVSNQTPTPTSGVGTSQDDIPPTPQSIESNHPNKRRKTSSFSGSIPIESAKHHDPTHPHTRQVHSDTRFPQRKKPETDGIVLEPTSTDKLIAGIWRQLFSSVKLSQSCPIIEPGINIRTGVSGEVFRAVNTLCVKYYNHSHSSRALEMIVQAYWIDCYEARIAVLRLENPNCPMTEARMMALKEACAVLNWKEKDLRNRIAIWRGYKEIKDAGGWASLIFASSGVYRFCKYRSGFNGNFATRLRQLQSAFEVAADTLHPEWRELLHVIGQAEPRRYHGHPHEWVTVTTGPAVPLGSTYGHLSLPDGFHYRFLDECVIDSTVFEKDPRMMPGLDKDICRVCRGRQADEVEANQCVCFPTVFGGVKAPVAVQLVRTAGKNNGIIARSDFDRGTAIGEFIGFITAGIKGRDVMVGQGYQIFQGEMGNFTRFINHSCRPNSQFERFCWRGKERIIVVSRGVSAGSEVTVDYSDGYWEELEKKCLCGENNCRYI
ncbi:hypothetical protein ASPWEDRAFT_56140 [Aspergillus wentii DTO 134E9]|uniref:SET domain-containing protein n=1 Tax=Aspergillus wentii DTO 134E9 TaxID=1073089 RepID=A0A1L9S103_ASPWE|nr:uncharacterized protein ASPWEDRAFT_56140 [Aspergillus wentii DTO 134E9]OJJ40842.1 hypothetical protein ASPWEDRAFT_56140 [Aspergillus wentii DTO 134E9]